MSDDGREEQALSIASGAEPLYLSPVVDRVRKEFAQYEQPDGAFIDPQPAEPRGPGLIARLLKRTGLRS